MTNSRRSILFGILGILAMMGLNVYRYYFYIYGSFNILDQIDPVVLPASMLGLVLAAFALVYGIKAKRENDKKANLGIGLAIFIVVMVLFPVWPYFVGSS